MEKAEKTGKLAVGECRFGIKSFVLPLKSSRGEIMLYVMGGHFRSHYEALPKDSVADELGVSSKKLQELQARTPVLDDRKFKAVIEKLEGMAAIYEEEISKEEQDRKVLKVVNFISELARQFTGKISLRELLLSIVNKFSSVFDVDRCAIALLDDLGQSIDVYASNNEFADEIFGGRVEPGKGATGIVTSTGQTFYSRDARRDRRLSSTSIKEWNIRSLLSVPMKLGDRIIGVLHLGIKKARRVISEREIEFTEALASEVALLVETARLYNESQKKAIDLARSRDEIKSYFTKIGTAMATLLDLRQLLQLIVEISVNLTHADAGSIYLIEDKRLSRYVAVAYDDRQEGDAKPIRDRKISASTTEHFLEEMFDPSEIKSYLGIPLERKGEVNGLLNIVDRKPRSFSPEDVEMLSIFAGHAALAIDNAQLFMMEQKKAREATALYQASKSIGESVDLDEVLSLSVEQLTKTMELDRCLILLLDYKKLELYLASQVGLSDEQKEFFSFFRIPIDDINDELWESLVQGRPVSLPCAPCASASLQKFFQVFPASSCLLVPLFTKNQLIGIIYLDDSRLPHNFTDSQVRLVMTLALQIASAIQRATLVEQMENNLDQLKALHQVSTAVTGTLSLPKVFDLIVDKASSLIGAPATSMLAWEDSTRDYVMEASLGLTGDMAKEEFHRLISDKTGKRRRHMTYYISADVEGEDPLIYSTLKSSGMGGYVSVPLITRKKVMGVLNCFCNEDDKFDSQEIRLLRSFANQAAIAIENARLYAIIKNKVRELATVFEVGKSITSTLELDKVLDEITSSVAKVMEADAVSIMNLDEERQELMIIKTLGLGKYHRGETIRVGSGIAGIAAKLGRPMVLHDEENSPSPYKFPEQVKRDGLRTLLSVPLKVRDKVIGLINIYKKLIYQFLPTEINLLSTLANQAAVAIENARLYNEQYDIAQIIQRNLMPSREIKHPGVDIGYIYIPSEILSGDYFEVISLGEKHFSLVIADVSGKGTQAAIYNARGKYIIRSYAKAGYSPGHILTLLNQLMEEETGWDKFISLLYIDVDLKKMKITYSSAGHEPLILWDDSEKEACLLGAPNLPIGVFPGTVYDEMTRDVAPGDIMLLYTDGITEGRSREGDFFGTERVVEILKENFHLSAQALANKIHTRVQKFTRRNITDDLSLLVARI
jgi:GAF domain-containing protein